MSTKAIWSLNATRHELGNATKGQIYLSKVAIGFASAFVLWLVSLGSITTVVIASMAIFVTSKVCYYINTGDWPDGWDCVADWICDGCLHMAWFAGYSLRAGNLRIAGAIALAWLITYPWSCE